MLTIVFGLQPNFNVLRVVDFVGVNHSIAWITACNGCFPEIVSVPWSELDQHHFRNGAIRWSDIVLVRPILSVYVLGGEHPSGFILPVITP